MFCDTPGCWKSAQERILEACLCPTHAADVRPLLDEAYQVWYDARLASDDEKRSKLAAWGRGWFAPEKKRQGARKNLPIPGRWW